MARAARQRVVLKKINQADTDYLERKASGKIQSKKVTGQMFDITNMVMRGKMAEQLEKLNQTSNLMTAQTT